jgi:small-conductance mechanosensitive channel
MRRLMCVVLVGGACACARPAVAQPQALPPVQDLTAERVDQTETVSFFNRPIVTLRARVAGRSPAERALGAERRLHDILQEGLTPPVGIQRLQGGALITVGSRGVLVVTPADIDELAGDTLDGVAADAAGHLQQALSEAAEIHRPRALLRAAALSVLAVALAVFLFAGLLRLRVKLTAALAATAERRLASAGIAPVDVKQKASVRAVERHAVTTVITAVYLVVAYGVSTFVLHQFPYTRPWGESMRAFFLSTFSDLALGAARAVPGLLVVGFILAIARLVIRLAGAWFSAVERGRTRVTWIHPETVQPSRRLLSLLVWVFAVIVAYPYMPGSQTDGFKGMTVFLGLVVTFGSTGLVNHIMSGFMITYSRALRLGDFVRIGDVEGTVTNVGVLSTKVKTVRGEAVTIPNAVVVATTTIDYSRLAEEVVTPITVTIGYNTPWRQVHALLLQAAGRTSGLRRTPKPKVVQEALEDFYVKYTLLVCLEQQHARLYVLDALHANIQDLFNEYGVQIMSPNYVFDPATPKVVTKDQWFAPPASEQRPRG